MYKYSIIICSYNGKKYLEDCLGSVLRSKNNNFEVIFIDDASNDGSLEILKKYENRSNFRLFVNKQNIGLVKNRNKGISLAKGEILIFLDNDTEVDRNWINGLEKVFLSDDKIGAAQCKIYDFHKRNTIQQVGMKLVPFTGFGITIGRGERNNKKYCQMNEIISLGAALAVRKSVAKRIDGFDDRLFHYTDDLDFSWRVWISGYKVVLAPDAIIYHYLKIHPPTFKLYYHLSKNSLRMILKNYEWINVLKYLPFSLIFCITGAIYVLLRGNMSGIIGTIAGLIWSIKNLGDTLTKRKLVQKNRIASDSTLFPKIMINDNLPKYVRNYFIGSKTTELMMDGRL